MKRFIHINILFFVLSAWPVYGAEQKDDMVKSAQYYSVLVQEGMSPYKEGRVAYVENGKTYTAVLDENWEKTDVRPAPELDALSIEGHFAYDSSGKIYYSKNGELYSSVWKNNKWGKPHQEKIVVIKADRKTLRGSLIAYSGWRYKPGDVTLTGIYNPSLSEDGKRLYYTSKIDSTKGGRDIWYSDLNDDGSRSGPVNMDGRVNTSSDEDIPMEINSVFYYTSGLSPEKVSEENMFYVPVESRVSPRTIASLLAPKPEVEIAGMTRLVEPAEPLVQANDPGAKVYEKDANTCIFLFDYNNDHLTGSQEKELQVILDFINRRPDGEFMITGYTDERGTQPYNQDLSERRAKKIRDLLIERGAPVRRLHFRGMGKQDPIVKNAQTEEEHQKNRRVEIENIK